MLRWYWIVGVALTVLALGASALLYGRLPEQIPTHWNWHGKIDSYGPRWTIFLLPGAMILTLGLTRVLPWLSPKGFEIDSFRGTYLYTICVLALMAYMHAVILYATTHAGFDLGRVLVGGILLFFVMLGNVMGEVRRNFFIGIRTPWTLASERVWVDTHRFAARTMVAGGLVGFVFVVAFGWLVAGFVAVMAGALAPVLYSLVLYKRLQRAGQI